MPCVCLSNTFRQWQTTKASKLELRKQELSRRQVTKQQCTEARQARHAQIRASWQAIRAQRQAQKLARQEQRRQRQQAKLLAKRAPRSAPTVIQPQLTLTKPASKITEETLHIPHPRKSLALTATVSQTLTAAISAQMLASKSAQVSKSGSQPASTRPDAHPSAAAQSRPLPTNVLNMPPITPEELHPGASRADLINAESRLGSRIFGPIPYGHRREFFHDRQNIWIWHEDWQDQTQHLHQLTVRYEVRASGVYKKISTGKYFRLEGDELDNFCQATKAYLYLIKKYLYRTPTAPAV